MGACTYCACDVAFARVAGLVAVAVSSSLPVLLLLLLLLLLPLLLHMPSAWTLVDDADMDDGDGDTHDGW